MDGQRKPAVTGLSPLSKFEKLVDTGAQGKRARIS
jgi:hypothetical protein